MTSSFTGMFRPIFNLFQTLSLFALVVVSTALVGLSALAALGHLPWPDLALSFDGTPVPQAGRYATIGLTALAVALFFFLPSAWRMRQLEQSHRDFTISMDDVARAYHIAHSADREGAFDAKSEFDTMRDRIAHLRAHPHLETLEPALLEVAAQMSHESRELANIYSDEKIARARTFLKQRQEEMDAHLGRITAAKKTCDELRRWLREVTVEEQLVERQLDRLEDDLRELLPLLGFEFGDELPAPAPAREAKVVPMPSKPAE